MKRFGTLVALAIVAAGLVALLTRRVGSAAAVTPQSRVTPEGQVQVDGAAPVAAVSDRQPVEARWLEGADTRALPAHGGDPSARLRLRAAGLSRGIEHALLRREGDMAARTDAALAAVDASDQASVELSLDWPTWTRRGGREGTLAIGRLLLRSGWALRVEWMPREGDQLDLDLLDPLAPFLREPAPLTVLGLSPVELDDSTATVRVSPSDLEVRRTPWNEGRVRIDVAPWRAPRSGAAQGSRAEISGVPLGAAVLTQFLRSDGAYGAASHVHDGTEVWIPLRLGTRIEGRIVDAQGEPLRQAYVTLRVAADQGWPVDAWNDPFLAQAGADGTFRCAAPRAILAETTPSGTLPSPPSRATLTFHRTWYESAEREVELSPGATVNLGLIELQPRSDVLWVASNEPIHKNATRIGRQDGATTRWSKVIAAHEHAPDEWRVLTEESTMDALHPPAHLLMLRRGVAVGLSREGQFYATEPTRSFSCTVAAAGLNPPPKLARLLLSWHGLRAEFATLRGGLGGAGGRSVDFELPATGTTLAWIEGEGPEQRPPVELGPVEELTERIELWR